MTSYSTKLLTSADGEPVGLHDFGGDGPDLLMGHGNGLNAGMWMGTLPYLRPHFHCHGVDLRGHGAARKTSSDYSVERERFAEDVFACIDALGGAPIRYAGHSLGAASATVAALRRPERFVGLWLFEPVLIPDDFDRSDGDQPSFLIEASRRRRMEFASVDDAFERFSSKPPFSGCDPASVRGYVEIGTYPVEGGVRLSCEGSDEARVFGSGSPIDFKRLASLTMPAVVAAGANYDEAHAIPARVASSVAASLGNARLEMHEGMSHFGPMEAPERVAASIIELFGTDVGSAS